MIHSGRVALVVSRHDLFTRAAQILRNSQASPPVAVGPGAAQTLRAAAQAIKGAYDWNRYVIGKAACSGGEEDQELCKLLGRLGGPMDGPKWQQYWLDIRGHSGTLCLIADGEKTRTELVESATVLCDRLARVLTPHAAVISSVAGAQAG